jgi:putative ABC transport system permease protein
MDRERVSSFHDQLLERIVSLPNVEGVSISNNLPGLSNGWQTDIAIDGVAVRRGELLNVDWSIVSPDYFSVMKIPILQGRTFTTQESMAGAPLVLVDETLARRFWPNGDALGKYLKYDSPTPHEIIGIVGSVKYFGSESLPRIRLYSPLGRMRLNTATLSVRMKSPDTTGIMASVKREIHNIDSDLPVREGQMMDQIFARQASLRKFNTVLLGLFSAVALLLSVVGIYGVMSYTVIQRTREIGIRMALGAKTVDLFKLIVGEGMLLVIIGLSIGLVAALAMTRVMSSLLFGVSATDPATFAAVLLLLMVVALLACFIPARRATRVSPMVALRHE